MKKIITVLLLMSSLTFGQLAISAVFDCTLTGGTPKGVELYVVADIADLSIFGIGSANNGGGSDGQEFTFPADAVSAGDYIYVSSEATQFNNWFGFVPDYTGSAVNVNGDDAIELFMNGSVIDVYGDINVIGDYQPWDYTDGWAASNNGRIPSATFNPADWTYSGRDALDGEANNTTAASPVPIGNRTPLPVELTTFSASILEQNVELNWETATEVNNYGFEVERKIEEGEWSKLDFVSGHGNSNSPKYYSFVDNSMESSGKYFYRLKQVDIDGTYEYSDVIEANLGAPNNFELNQNYPNPFNPTTSIQFNLPQESEVKLSVFNVLGEEVAELLNNKIAAGYHSVNFNAGHLNSGIYFYKLESNNFTQIRKMMLVK